MSRSLHALLRMQPPWRTDSICRREYLKASLATGLGLLFSHDLGCSRPVRASKRVVIVGAGFAGLTAGHELHRAGYDVRVFEARPQVGGRVRSTQRFIPGRNVEFGGELIGSNHPVWLALADQFQLSFLDVTEDVDAHAPVAMDGTVYDVDQSSELWEGLELALTAMNSLARHIHPDLPWTVPNADQLDHATVADWIAEQECSERCKKCMTILLSADNGVPTTQQSLLGMLAMVNGGGVERFWSESEVYRCRGGNQQLAHRLAEVIGSDRIQLRTPVSAIMTNEQTSCLTLADGTRYEADEIILTIPPSVWNTIEFTPPLPVTLVPQMGTNIKFFPAVQGRFWENSRLSQYSLSDGPATLTWDGTDAQSADGPACLTVFAGGLAAETGRGWHRDERERRYLEELARVYPAIHDHFVRSAFLDWPSEKYTRAGYSFPAPGQVTTVAPVLHRGLPRLHFAGEHCSPAFTGYMEGALSSGARIARQIAVRDGVIR